MYAQKGLVNNGTFCVLRIPTSGVFSFCGFRVFVFPVLPLIFTPFVRFPRFIPLRSFRFPPRFPPFFPHTFSLLGVFPSFPPSVSLLAGVGVLLLIAFVWFVFFFTPPFSCVCSVFFVFSVFCSFRGFFLGRGCPVVLGSDGCFHACHLYVLSVGRVQIAAVRLCISKAVQGHTCQGYIRGYVEVCAGMDE